MAGWILQLLSGPGINPATWGVQSDLTGATDRRISVYLDQPHEISFSMNANHPETQLIEELYGDVAASYDPGDGGGPQRLVRCRIGPTSDDGDADTVTTQFRALSYRSLLGRKLIYSGDSFKPTPPATNIENLGWLMISAAQGRPNGTLGITRGTLGPSSAVGGSVSGVTFAVAMGMQEQLDQVFADAGGYDWDITGGLVYQTYVRPRRSQGLLDYGGSVVAFNRTVDPSEYANAIIVTGGDDATGNPVAPEGDERESGEVAAGTARQGRWEKAFSDIDLKTLARIAARGAQLIAETQVLQPTYTVTLKPGMWGGPADLWVGDSARLLIRAGRLNVDTRLLVTSMIFAVGDDGADTVTVTLDGLSPRDAYFRKQVKLLSDLARLERR